MLRLARAFPDLLILSLDMLTRVVLLLLASFTTVSSAGSGSVKDTANEVEDQGGRIWNGEDADANSFPFMARLRGDYRCGGSIISERVSFKLVSNCRHTSGCFIEV